MKKSVYKFKNIKKNDIYKSFFVLFMLVFFAFIFINFFDIQFWLNGFDKILTGDLQVYYLDVGQASSTLIIFPNEVTFLIDTGDASTTDEYIYQLSNIMQKHDKETIDFLLLTHPDTDHVGGTVAVLERFQVYTVMRPKVLSTSENEIEVTEAYRIVKTEAYAKAITAIYNEPMCDVKFVCDLVMTTANCTIQIDACKKSIYTDTNAYSPFISVNYAGKTFMFTGDATATREKEFLNECQNVGRSLSVDFLLVSHHGSSYSTTEQFLQYTKPSYAIISAGDEKHPSQKLLTRLRNSNVENVLCTKSDGLIGIGVFGDGTFCICTMANSIDFPLLIVLLSCLVLMIWNISFGKNSQNKK